jgi:hypothetical protein
MAIDGSRMIIAAKKAKLKSDNAVIKANKPKVTPLPKILYRFQKVKNEPSRQT